MNKILIAVVAIILLVGVFLMVTVVGVANQETQLANAIKATQTNNKNQMDTMWKTIAQAAEVTQEQKNALMEIFTSYAQARSQGTGSESGALANWIQEAVPNVDTATFKNLQNIIVSKRETFALNQTKLLDLSREHHTLLESIPSNMILAFMGRKPIDVVIVTSTRTENAFQTGTDDNVSVFPQ